MTKQPELPPPKLLHEFPTDNCIFFGRGNGRTILEGALKVSSWLDKKFSKEEWHKLNLQIIEPDPNLDPIEKARIRKKVDLNHKKYWNCRNQ